MSFFSLIPSHFQNHVCTFWTRNEVCRINVLRNNFLCIIVYTIVFDMQYRPFYLRGPSNVDTMSSLVVLKERGTISNTSNNVSPCNISPSMIRYFFTNNCKNSYWASFQEMAFGKAIAFLLWICFLLFSSSYPKPLDSLPWH